MANINDQMRKLPSRRELFGSPIIPTDQTIQLWRSNNKTDKYYFGLRPETTTIAYDTNRLSTADPNDSSRLRLQSINIRLSELEQRVVDESDDAELIVYGADHQIVTITTTFVDKCDGAFQYWKDAMNDLRLSSLNKQATLGYISFLNWRMSGGVVQYSFTLNDQVPDTITLGIGWLITGLENMYTISNGTWQNENKSAGVLSLEGAGQLIGAESFESYTIRSEWDVNIAIDRVEAVIDTTRNAVNRIVLPIEPIR